MSLTAVRSKPLTGSVADGSPEHMPAGGLPGAAALPMVAWSLSQKGEAIPKCLTRMIHGRSICRKLRRTERSEFAQTGFSW